MANYPSSASSDSNLYIGVNNKNTTLTAGIDASVTTIPVSSTTGFPAVGYISVDLEIIHYTSVDATNFLGATRAADGSTATTHGINSLVSHNIVAAHHNLVKDEVIAIETDLVGVNSSLTPVSPANTSTSILNRFNQIAQRFKDLTGLTNWYDAFTFFPISKGGTNSGTALNNNRVMQSSSGSIVEASAITASRALQSDSNGIPTHSAVTSTELGYVSGVTSALQTQINGKRANFSNGQLPGTNTNDSASSGNVGEYVSSSAGFANVPGATGAYGDITSVSLTAGDWSVSGNVQFTRSGATWSGGRVGISSNSGNNTTGLSFGDNQLEQEFTSSSSQPANFNISIVPHRISLSSTTTYYLKVRADYSAGTPQVAGRISAVRVR